MLKSIPPEEKKTYVTLYRTNGYSYTLTLLQSLPSLYMSPRFWIRCPLISGWV